MHLCTHNDTCFSEALAHAESFCKRHEVRLTPLRKRVLELLWQSHKPIKAYDILAQLQKEMPSAQPPTVYRALDFLLENHFIHKIQSLNAFIGCHYPQSEGRHCYFLICSHCTETQEMQHQMLEQTLLDSARQHQFLVRHVAVEVEGICKNCRNSN